MNDIFYVLKSLDRRMFVSKTCSTDSRLTFFRTITNKMY